MNGVALDDEAKGNEKSDDRLSTDVKLAVTRIDEKKNVGSGDLVAGDRSTRPSFNASRYLSLSWDIKPEVGSLDAGRRVDAPTPTTEESRKRGVVDDAGDWRILRGKRVKREEWIEGKARFVVAQVTRKIHHQTLAGLLNCEEDDAVDFATVLLPLVRSKFQSDAHTVQVLNKVFAGFAHWPDDRKIGLIEKLWANGFFADKADGVGFFRVVHSLRLYNLPPPFFLDFFIDKISNHNLLREFVRDMTLSHARHVLAYLTRYLESTAEQRLVELKTRFPFFDPADDIDGDQKRLKDENIVYLISIICRPQGPEMEPPDAFFRVKRSEFVERLVKKRGNNMISIENAAKQAVRFAGHDLADQKAMVLDLAVWRPVAELVKERTGVSVAIPPSECADDENLVKDKDCDATLHKHQTSTRVHVIKDRAAFEDLRSDLEGRLIYISIIANRDPRKITETPSVIILKSISLTSAKSKVCVVFPHEVEGSLVSAVLEHVSLRAPIITKTNSLLRSLMAKRNIELKHVKILNLQEVMSRHAVGHKGLNEMCLWLWEHQFCVLSLEEWLFSPLTEQQEYHLAYEMDLHTDFIRKIGLDNILQ